MKKLYFITIITIFLLLILLKVDFFVSKVNATHTVSASTSCNGTNQNVNVSWTSLSNAGGYKAYLQDTAVGGTTTWSNCLLPPTTTYTFSNVSTSKNWIAGVLPYDNTTPLSPCSYVLENAATTSVTNASCTTSATPAPMVTPTPISAPTSTPTPIPPTLINTRTTIVVHDSDPLVGNAVIYSGILKDNSGKPISNKVIKLINVADGVVIKSSDNTSDKITHNTDSYGNFVIGLTITISANFSTYAKFDGDSSYSSSQSSQITITPVSDVLSPIATISSPPTNNITVSGTVSIDVSAYDDTAVTKVEYFVDSVLSYADTTEPYSYAFNTTIYPNNTTHTISATAYDGVGHTSLPTSIRLTVNQTATPTPTLAPGVTPSPTPTAGPTVTPAPTPTPTSGPTPTPTPTSTPGTTYNISGVAFIDNNPTNQIKDSSEVCYNGSVTVSLPNKNPITYTQDSACINKYTFTQVPAGTYTLTIQPISGQSSTNSPAWTQTVTLP